MTDGTASEIEFANCEDLRDTPGKYLFILFFALWYSLIYFHISQIFQVIMLLRMLSNIPFQSDECKQKQVRFIF